MVEQSQRSVRKEASGPCAVEPNHRRDKHRGSSRPHKESDDYGKHRQRRSDSSKSPKKDSSHRRKLSNPQPAHVIPEQPKVELDVVGQPASVVSLGIPIEQCVMISLNAPSSERNSDLGHFDASGLFAITSLVVDARSGERVPIDPEFLCGQKSLDSIHPFPEHFLEALARDDPFRHALGYFSFTGLVVRQAGTYRLRTTLLRLEDAGATSLVAVDSEPIKIDRPNSLTRRRQ